MAVRNFCGRTRRETLWQSGCGFPGLALASLLAGDGFHGTATADETTPAFRNPLAPQAPLVEPRAKNVIFLYMYGGPSQIDTFDYKPNMYGMDGKTVDVKTFGRGGHRNQGRIVEPRWKFRQYGECGKWVSDLFPHLAQKVDDIAFIHSMTADSPIHGSAMLMMNSGRILSGHPCLGSWVNYGLGSVNENLPGFVVMLDPRGGPISGAKNWSSGYMPATYQASVMRSSGSPILDLQPPQEFAGQPQRRMLDTLRQLNQQHLQTRSDNSSLAARIASYELAWRMQSEAIDIGELSQESPQTLDAYGLNSPNSSLATYGRMCLLSRRLIEKGVRFVQIYNAVDKLGWDGHDNNTDYNIRNAAQTDQPIAALLQDLDQRGLLDSTLVIWAGEFGRTPMMQGNSGRNHNPYGFTVWLAGANVRAGTVIGSTDEIGLRAVASPQSVKNLHATLLTALGLQPDDLYFEHLGRQERLTGVAESWEVIPGALG